VYSAIIIICSLGLISGFVPGEPAEGREAKLNTKKAAKRKRAAKIVEAIVNRNKPPKLVDRPSGRPERVPLFPENYDWKEERRVGRALYRLYWDTSAEVWEELVRRKDDPRYCITVSSEDDSETPLIETVGSILNQLAHSRLVGVFQQHLPPDPGKDGWKIIVGVGINHLAAWRKERANKSLYQLQIEVCEEAVNELSKVKNVPKKDIDLSQKKIKAEIKKLRRTKRPIFLEYGQDEYLWYYHPVYSEQYAKRIRKALKSGSSENLAIHK
jgi:hypothetical protein